MKLLFSSKTTSKQVVASIRVIYFISLLEMDLHYGKLAPLIVLLLNSLFLILTQNISTNFTSTIPTG